MIDVQKLKEDEIFAVMNREGDIPAGSTEGQGLYLHDTRFLSVYELSVEGLGLQLLASSGELNFMSSLQFGNTASEANGHPAIPARTLSVRRNRFIENGLHERIGILNYNAFPIDLTVRLAVGSDFRDMFEVRRFVIPVARGTEDRPEVTESSVLLRYHGLDKVERTTRIDFDRTPNRIDVEQLEEPAPPPSGVQDDRQDTASALVVARACFDVHVEPHAAWSMAVHVSPALGEAPAHGPFPSLDDAFGRVLTAHEEWEATCTRVTTDNAVLNGLIRQSLHDLRLTLNRTSKGLVPVAGIPWFAVPFGRDSLITSLQTLSINPEIARGTLRFLAQYQGTELDPWRDQEPGKILHELRSGELAALREVPHNPYYATLDATPLFLYLLHEYIRWTGDWDLATELRPNVERALAWITEYGDRDGDGLLEYATRSPMGMRHHAWKDSGDSVQFPDGRFAEVPIAPIEVQGYAYAAELAMAELYRHWGESQRAAELLERAHQRQANFERHFWLEDQQFYAQALDADKVPVPAVTSNPGHCLLMGIVAPERAKAMAQRFMQTDMLSGWGLRTLSEQYASFNPMSYHNGSIWPHDNSLIVAGLSHLGFQTEALRVIEQVFDAGFRLQDGRLPELYCGFGRDLHYQSAPAAYPTACNPHAWAAAAPFLMLQAMIGLEPDVPNNRLRLRPALLGWVDALHLENLRLGDRHVSVHVWREGQAIRWSVDGGEGLEIVTS